MRGNSVKADTKNVLFQKHLYFPLWFSYKRGFPWGGRELAVEGGRSSHCFSVLVYGVTGRDAECEEDLKGLAMYLVNETFNIWPWCTTRHNMIMWKYYLWPDNDIWFRKCCWILTVIFSKLFQSSYPFWWIFTQDSMNHCFISALRNACFCH